MKSLKTKLWAVAVSAMATLSVVGCTEKPGPDPTPTPPMPDPENAIVMPNGYSIYTGDENKKGTAHAIIILYEKDVVLDESNWSLKGNGNYLWLDINTLIPPDERKLSIADGSYTAIDDGTTFAKFTYNRGWFDSQGGALGTFFGTVVNNKETADPIIDGTISISQSAGKYKIIVQATTKSGKALVYKYDNTLRIKNFGVPIPPADFDGKFVTAEAAYFDDFYEVGYGNMQLKLTDMEYDDKGYTIPPGHELGLDLNVPLFASQKDIKIEPGTYTIDYSGKYNKPMTFNVGKQEGQYIKGSYWVDINTEGGDAAVYLVDEGSFTVTQNGDTYTVEVDIVLHDGSPRKGTYSGKLKTFDESCMSRMEGDVNLTNFTQGQMAYRGDVEYISDKIVNWQVTLATSGIDIPTRTGQGDIIQLDINVAPNFTQEIPAGTYNLIEKIDNDHLLPFTYIPGFYASERMAMIGTWYRKDWFYTAPAVSGQITIAKAGSGYKIDFDLKDDYHYLPNKNSIKGSYTGELTFVDLVPKEEGVIAKSMVDPSKQTKRSIMNKSSELKRAIVRR